MLKRTICVLLVLLLGTAGICETTPSETETPSRAMLLGETSSTRLYEATLYYIDSDGVSLSPANRTLTIADGYSFLDAVLDALLSPSGNPLQASITPGDTQLISCEFASGIATVNLSVEARNVQSDQELLMMYYAIVSTLSEIEGVQGVNVLINDLHESVLQLPIGVCYGSEENVATPYAQLQNESERYLASSSTTITRTAAVYYPSLDGQWLIPEMREITFSRNDCASMLLDLLLAKPQSLSCAVSPLAGVDDPVLDEPQITVTSIGTRVLDVNLQSAAVQQAEQIGIEAWQIYGSIVLTMCSFIPELDAVRLSVDGEPINAADLRQETLNFEDGLMHRRDYSGFIGSASTIYLADDDGDLVLCECGMSQGESLSARALLEALTSEDLAQLYGAHSPLPEELDKTDILGIQIDDNIATVNLSARFYSACQSLDELGERTAVYAIVNTLCALAGIDGVQFLFEGLEAETLSEHIYLRSVLLPIPEAVIEWLRLSLRASIRLPARDTRASAVRS